MKVLKLFLTVIFISVYSVLYAQNPYESLGIKDSVLTYSKGKFKEIQENDTLVRIGSVVINTVTNEIAYFVKTDTIMYEAKPSPEIISRWLSPDPVHKAHESPYTGFANNPILFTDPDGKDNVIYIVVAKNKQGKPEISMAKVNDIVRKTNEMLKNNMGVNTRVAIIEEGTIVEKTDNVVAIGTNRQNIQKTIAKYSPNFANSEEITSWAKDNDPSNPEKGNNGISPDHVGGVVDVDDLHGALLGAAELYSPKYKAEAKKNIASNDPDVITGLTIIHSSGHAAQIGHTYNVMTEGTGVQEGIRNGTPASDYAEINGDDKKAWDARYSTNKASTVKAVGKRPQRTEVK